MMTQKEIKFLENLGFVHHIDPDGESLSKSYSLLVMFFIDVDKRLGSLSTGTVNMYIRGDMLRTHELTMRSGLKQFSQDLRKIRAEKILIEK